MKSRRTPPSRHRTRGAVVLALMIVVMVLLIGWLIYGAIPDNPRLAADSRAMLALGQARDALIGEARTRWCRQPVGTVADALPCPDVGGGGEGLAAAACAPVAVGRLPWRTLGLKDLRDAHGECLWYRRTATGAQVIAPGPAQGAQTRPTIAAAAVCGGHYGAADYLGEVPTNDIALDIAAADLAAPAGCGP